MEEGRDGQSGDDDGDAIVMADDTPQESLQANHQAKVNHGQHGCQCTVNQRAIDKNIDVPEPSAQDSQGNGERDEEHQEVDGSEDDQVSKGTPRGKGKDAIQEVQPDIASNSH